jgi:hypothetical protein
MSGKRSTELKSVAFGVYPFCLRLIADINLLGGRRGWGMSENADISEAERTLLGPDTDLSPHRCAGGELGRVGAAAKVTVHDHEHMVVSELAGRTPVILCSSLVKDPMLIMVALVYLERDRDGRFFVECVHAHGCDGLTLEEGGLKSFHE